MQSVERLEAESQQPSRTILLGSSNDYNLVSIAIQGSEPAPALNIARSINFGTHGLAGDPSPISSPQTVYHEEHRFSFKANPLLSLVVEGPVQTADIEVDSPHTDTPTRSR